MNKLSTATADRRGRPAQRGQVIVILALALTALIGMGGLVIDGGMAYVNRRVLQNAADAGSLDGTRVFARYADRVCTVEAAARKAAVDAALVNGVSQASSVVTGLVDIDGNAMATCNATRTKGISTNVEQSYSTFFARVLGFNSIKVGATGTARFGFINQLMGSMPIVLNRDSLPANPNDGAEHKAVLSPAGSTGIGPVNFGTIDPTPNGQTLANALEFGLQINMVANKGCGTPPKACKAGSITTMDPLFVAAINARINSAPTETWSRHAPDSRRVVVLPVINGDIGNATVIPIGFALVFLDSIQGPSQNALTIHFLSGTIAASGARIDPLITSPSPGTPTLVQLVR
jgi:hypothetical protein